jgi:NADH dehydrogenase FAD-containing subunit
MRTRSRVLVLGAGFGGLELTTVLSDALGDAIDIVLIDRQDLKRDLLLPLVSGASDRPIRAVK